MSMINEQIKRLRAMALVEHSLNHYETEELLNCAAYTIEELSAKLAIANMERSTAYYNDGWIPCNQELPPQPKRNPLFENKPLDLYLVSLDGSAYPWRAFWNGNFFTDGWNKVEPIAWRQLPAPYQPKGEE